MKLFIGFMGMLFSGLLFAGPYFGFQTGLASSQIKEEAPGIKFQYGDSAGIYGAYAGYRFDLADRTYLALELDGFLGDAGLETQLGNLESTGKRESILGAHLLAGIPVGSEGSVYGRVGYARADFSAVSGTQSYDKGANGLVLGIGTKYDLAKNMGIRFDYRYIDYNNFKFAEDSNFTYNANDQIFLIGLDYNF